MPVAAAITETLVEIAKLTASACGNSAECATRGYAGRPYRCCSRLYCEAARRYCQSKGITLPDAVNLDLPFMGPTGCVLPPEHRPICAIHTCQWTGSDHPHCGGQSTTSRYIQLYDSARVLDDGWWQAFESVRSEVGQP